MDHLTHGTTGLITWQGAACLLDWAHWSQQLKGKRVLELGSGIGQFGLTGVQCLEMTELTLSDFHFAVLNYLHLNIKLNLCDEPPSQKELQKYLREGYSEPYTMENVRYTRAAG